MCRLCNARAMPRRAPGAAPKLRGRPRKPLDELKERARRYRRSRYPNEGTALVAVAEALLCDTKEHKKIGRPLKAWADLKNSSRRCRIHRARLTEKRVPELQQPMLDAARGMAADREQHAELEAARALARLQHVLSNRNEGADGPSALTQKTAAVRADGSPACVMCLHSDDDAPYCPTHMRCCGQVMCARCLGVWLQTGGERWKMGYGSGMHGESGGELLTEEPVDTHRCPLCNHRCLSVARGLVRS